MATASSNMFALRATFLVTNRIVKSKTIFIISEELILPTNKDICHEVLEEATVKKVEGVYAP